MPDSGEGLRPRGEQQEAQRCPYCHGALGEPEGDEALVRCEGCGTDHHAACIEELGRCTVLGCEQPLTAEALERDQAHMSPQARAVRRQIRHRVRSFVRDHARRPARYGEMDPRDVARLIDPHDPSSERMTPIGQVWGDVVRMVLPLVIACLLAAVVGLGVAVLLGLV